ncbi:MAG TPA: hypothetical protein VNO31_35870, partial [Umezawaea sp.]|nr:hypothetical protein [Umezawaea sp.]
MSRTSSRPAREKVSPAGYLVAGVVDVVLLVLIHVAPGWHAVPFLTERAGDVVPVVTAGLVLGLVVNLVYLARPRPLVFRLGDVATTAVALLVVERLRLVFPFDFGRSAIDWTSIVEVALPVLSVLVLIALLV